MTPVLTLISPNFAGDIRKFISIPSKSGYAKKDGISGPCDFEFRKVESR